MDMFIFLFAALLPQISIYIPPAPLLLLLLLIKRRDMNKANLKSTDEDDDIFNQEYMTDFIFHTDYDTKVNDYGPVLNIKSEDKSEKTGKAFHESDFTESCGKTSHEDDYFNIDYAALQEYDDTNTLDKIVLGDQRPITVEKLINDKFEGCTIDAFLDSGSVGEGEVIFDFEGIVTVKNIDGVYYINSDSINIFK